MENLKGNGVRVFSVFIFFPSGADKRMYKLWVIDQVVRFSISFNCPLGVKNPTLCSLTFSATDQTRFAWYHLRVQVLEDALRRRCSNPESSLELSTGLSLPFSVLEHPQMRPSGVSTDAQ